MQNIFISKSKAKSNFYEIKQKTLHLPGIWKKLSPKLSGDDDRRSLNPKLSLFLDSLEFVKGRGSVMKNSDWWIPRSVLPPCLSNFVLFSYTSFTSKTEQKSPSIFAGEEIRKKGKKTQKTQKTLQRPCSQAGREDNLYILEESPVFAGPFTCREKHSISVTCMLSKCGRKLER